MSFTYEFSDKSFEYEKKIHRELGLFEFIHVKLTDGWDETIFEKWYGCLFDLY